MPDFNTLRRRLVARSDGAGSLRRLLRQAGTSSCRSRRAASFAHRSIARRIAATPPSAPRSSSSTSSRILTRPPREKKYIDIEPIGRAIEDYHILQGTKEEFLIGAIRSHSGAIRDSGGVVEGRVGARPAGDRIALRRSAGDGRPSHDLQAGRQRDRLEIGTRGHVHGQVG